MHITKLHLVGFKTFADRTEIEFGDGLTAVVGPNGCGKSNIADALLWVMGEQNPRLLRGSESRDVIFTGTDRRKPLGMAEVRLTIDNADHALPVRFGEVTITRRVFRSGESQYLLNGSPCRLKDIVELFMDTGLGKGAYSFVGQNEVEAVLSARPEDRRELFEEAAGIKKYRVRKKEAVRKLEQAEANLTRIRDIVLELERQRVPLAEQAEEAKRYLELTARLQEIEVELLVSELQKADYELYASRRDRDLGHEEIQRLDADLGRMERESEAVGARLAEAEAELDSARMSQQGALTAVERIESQLLLAAERGRGAEQSADQIDQELRELAERITGLHHQVDAQTLALKKTEAAERARRDELAAARARLQEIDAAHAQAVQRSEDRQGTLRELAEQRAQRERALATCRSRCEETEARLAQLQELLGEIDRQTAEVDARVAEARHALEASAAERAALTAERDSLDGEHHQARDAQVAASVRLDAARRLLAERSSRLATLAELQESGDGFYQGVRAVLKAHKERRLTGSYAPVVDLLSVGEEYRVAVEVALGGSLQDIVCATEAEAKAGIELLKAQRAGRATFLALPLLRPAPRLRDDAIRPGDGLLGVAADLVGTDPRYEVVLDLLLGRVVVADGMDAAIRASRRLHGWSRIVTLDGELLTPGGALTGGSLQGKGAHLVGRKGEIDDLKGALPGLGAEVERLAGEVERAGRRSREAEAARTRVGERLADVQARAAALESSLSSAEREAARLAAAHRDTSAERTRLSAAHVALAHEVDEWTAALAAGRADDTSADDAIAAAQAEARRLSVAREDARTAAVALEVEAGRLAEKRAAQHRALAANEEALGQAQSARQSRQAQREMAGTQWRDADALRAELEAKIAAAREHLARCEAHFATWRDRRQALLNDSFERNAAIKDASKHRAETMTALHDAELLIARLEVRQAQTIQRLNDDYGISHEDALARPDPGDIERRTVTEVARLRRDIRQMGTVNTGAMDEYERLSERHAFLSGQQADIEQARESLLKTIAEIDDSTRGTFMETFEAVQAEFARLFEQLFGGGTTRLLLTDPDDLLETGIDVIAQPPGKKPQHLSLLSGGERALTAVALLFSFLAVRPSPFVLLDEVDAPLDGANVEKFVGMVKEFAERTQFLVITHNPTTMEAAPRWYGVTMQEAGISRVLSYRVPPDAVASEPEEPLLPGPAAARNGGARLDS